MCKSIKQLLNKSEIKINHGNLTAKWQYIFWSVVQKAIFLSFIYSYNTRQNWQMEYFLTLLLKFQGKRTIEAMELNCDFAGYDDPRMSLVQFYFAGTRSFQEGPDGTLVEGSQVSTEDDLANWVPELGSINVDGWDYGDGTGIHFICLYHNQEEHLEKDLDKPLEYPNKYRYSKSRG